jgi:hypothetical protein
MANEYKPVSSTNQAVPLQSGFYRFYHLSRGDEAPGVYQITALNSDDDIQMLGYPGRTQLPIEWYAASRTSHASQERHFQTTAYQGLRLQLHADSQHPVHQLMLAALQTQTVAHQGHPLHCHLFQQSVGGTSLWHAEKYIQTPSSSAHL